MLMHGARGLFHCNKFVIHVYVVYYIYVFLNSKVINPQHQCVWSLSNKYLMKHCDKHNVPELFTHTFFIFVT